MKILLVGNPNCGKTTLFNALTGAHERVSNRAGVTVDHIERKMRGADAVIVDLPGIYSLNPHSMDEQIASEAIAAHKPDLIVNIVDATNLQRNLFLTTQLMELGVPQVVALNMMDEAKKLGLEVDASELERTLGLPIIPIVAKTGDGLSALKRTIFSTHKCPSPLCKACSATARYRCLERVGAPNKARVSVLDRVLTHRWLGFPIFFAIMALVFYLTFGSVGAYLSEGAKKLGELLCEWVRSLMSSSPYWLSGLIVDGILNGVTGVLTFLPQIALLFGFLSLLEDSGYLARIAFIMDAPMRRLGLDGKAFVPLLMGFGCTVPAALATRTLGSRRERGLTLLMLPFLPCSAKLPVFALISSCFFKERSWLVILALYAMGIAVAVLTAMFFGGKRRSEPFLMELPPYRRPTFRNTWMQISVRTGHFLYRAGTIILIMSAVLWALMHFSVQFAYTDQTQSSLLGAIGTLIAPAFSPLGFGFWQAAVALIVGLIAKEAVLSSLLLFYGGSLAAIQAAFTPLSAFCFLTFVLLYPPCFASVITIHRERRSRLSTAFALLFWPIVAYAVCLLISLLAR